MATPRYVADPTDRQGGRRRARAKTALRRAVKTAGHRWRAAVGRFWVWYRRHYLATLVLTTVAFLMQALHLCWLFSDVIVGRLTGHSLFVVTPIAQVAYALVDLLEVPALLSASLLYVFELRSRVSTRGLVLLTLLNTQWLHMLWLTDEVVIATLAQQSFVSWNAAVAWVAILIDYLEVPVMIDSARKVYQQRSDIWQLIRTNGNVLGRTAFVGCVAASESRRPDPGPGG